ncbi:MAG TPA: hypothetical protein VMB50_24130 [Myxococcales bacterium]|nr:hypothetical protein [Myxococcales bacterium]
MRAPFASLIACLLLWPLDCAHGSQSHEASPAPAADAGKVSVDGGVAQVPPGCRENLSGEWQHQDDSSYRFSAVDDGGQLTLKPYRVLEGADAGLTPNDMSIELSRTPAGFVGQFKMMESMEGGKRCPASFGAKVVACEPGKMTLRIEQSYAVDQDCHRVATTPDIAEHVLVRRPAAPENPAKAAAPADAGR